MPPPLVATLADLVAINSVNAALPGGPGEAELAGYLAVRARRSGAEVETFEVSPGRANVLGWLRRGGRPTLMFECHMDTVALAPMPDALNPRIADGRLYGRGSADPKGSLAAFLTVFDAAAADPAFPVDLCLAAVVDEEITMTGSRALATRGVPVDAAVVGEPTRLQIIVAEKGALRWRVRTRGTATHSATPERGHNAIYDMGPVIDALRDGLTARLLAPAHPMLGAPTWSVGTIRGGVAVNVVPDRCEIEVDRRLLPGDSSAEILADVDRGLARLRAVRPALRVERDAPFVEIPPMETSPDAPIVRAAQSAVRAAGLDAAPTGVPYATDAAMLAGLARIPCVVLGPGDIAQAHTDNEWIALDQLERAVGIYTDLCRAFGDLGRACN
ncbi:MAG: M20 family metallopeptidase [Actinobacteria bacterium]|nr:M20 family metallopeptidase [Actinomycetota bacterium]